MKISAQCILAGVMLLMVASSRGQVTVEVTQEQQQFLLGEPLKTAVRITNLSGQDLQLGAEDDWLSFAIETRDGTVVPKAGETPIQGEFTLPSSKVAIKRVDLAPYFVFPHPGTFQIVATVRIRGWNRELISLPKSFDLVQGVKLWEQEVGVPRPSGQTNAEPEVRRYILQQANYLRGQMRLYLRVADTYGKPIRVSPLGPIVSFGRPETQVDRLSNLHVLYQEGSSSFNYVVCSLDGDILQRQTYDYAESRPRLRSDEDGNLVVRGGLRRVTPNDIPAPKEDDETGVTNKLSAASTSSQPAPPAGAKP